MPQDYSHGYSRETIAANIATFMSRGMDQQAAIARAYKVARLAWRERHPFGPYPEHIREVNVRKPPRPRHHDAHRHALEHLRRYFAKVETADGRQGVATVAARSREEAIEAIKAWGSERGLDIAHVNIISTSKLPHRKAA
jgi:hypothetical protein